jgi:hypothetical protein
MCIFSVNVQKVLQYIDQNTMPITIPDFNERREHILTILTDGLALPAKPGGKKRGLKQGDKR